MNIAAIFLTVFMIFGCPAIVNADLNDGLVVYYPFNGNTHDESGYGNDAIAHGEIQYVAGRNGRAIYFNNPVGHSTVTQWLELPYSNSIKALEDSSFTISICFTSTDDGQRNGRLFGNKQSIVLDYNSGAQINAYGWMRDNGGTQYLIAHDLTDPSIAVVTDGEFHCVSIILDRDQQLLMEYVDNMLVDSISVPNLSEIDFSGLVLGATTFPDQYGAKQTSVDELRIYNRALSAPEIRAIYNNQEGYNEGFEAGKEYCRNHPEECGIIYASGVCATFDLFTNTLHIPCLDMGTSYWLDLELISSDPVQLRLTGFGEN